MIIVSKLILGFQAFMVLWLQKAVGFGLTIYNTFLFSTDAHDKLRKEFVSQKFFQPSVIFESEIRDFTL